MDHLETRALVVVNGTETPAVPRTHIWEEEEEEEGKVRSFIKHMFREVRQWLSQ